MAPFGAGGFGLIDGLRPPAGRRACAPLAVAAREWGGRPKDEEGSPIRSTLAVMGAALLDMPQRFRSDGDDYSRISAAAIIARLHIARNAAATVAALASPPAYALSAFKSLVIASPVPVSCTALSSSSSA